jgi:hypothetical protein
MESSITMVFTALFAAARALQPRKFKFDHQRAVAPRVKI